MKHTLVYPDGALGQTQNFTDAPPSLSPNKGRWLPSEPPAFDPATHYAEPSVPVPQDALSVSYTVLPLPSFVPPVVSMRQARLALLGAGLLASVNSAVASMTGPSGDAARIEWEYAATVKRNSPLVSGLSSALSLTTEQLDALFTTAATL